MIQLIDKLTGRQSWAEPDEAAELVRSGSHRYAYRNRMLVSR